ncbi:MAG: hypothetical protein HOQ29_00940, partial [Acidobacteria bacterium]|nr:hypothetical protein [Acidobacteriota bacterium]
MASAQSAVIKVAYFNIQSGKGEPGLPGHPVLFSDNTNCIDPSQPMNGWGVGFVQKELVAKLSDPSVIALGLEEAWSCGSPENVRQALGWKARTSEHNGVGLVARYGLAGPEFWQQLDTTKNSNPADTMWALRVPVCLDAACTQSMPVYVAHWYGSGTYGQISYDTQAQQTVAFIQSTTAAGEPHVFGGDLNVWEGSGVVCNQTPNNSSLTYLRNAGYMDGWKTVNGAAEGYTGMTNRTGCGYPEGYAWKRIDYVWSQPTFLPTAMERFGVSPAGDATASDHYGIIATFPYPGAVAPPPPPPPPP